MKVTTQNVFSLRSFSSKPHLAGSQRSLDLALEIERKWRDFGFNDVALPEYEVLLSLPRNKTANTAEIFDLERKQVIYKVSDIHQDRLGRKTKSTQTSLRLKHFKNCTLWCRMKKIRSRKTRGARILLELNQWWIPYVAHYIINKTQPSLICIEILDEVKFSNLMTS